MNELIIALMPDAVRRARVLVRSLRTFGGALADCPVWMLVPATLPAATQAELHALDGVRVIPFEVTRDVLDFPFAGKVWAAAAAEAEAAGQTTRLAWLDTDTLFIQAPGALLIPAEKRLGYNPVHHRLIGARYDEPLDAFWSLMYTRCAVPAEHVFPMQTIIGAEPIRPYINAGLMVVRPAEGLLRAWQTTFAALYRDPACAAFYEQHPLYRIFIHQTVLAAVLLARLEPADWLELPRTFNYPLHLYADHDPAQRPAMISDLITCRYESVFDTPGWQDHLPMTDTLRQWIETQFATMPDTRRTS